MGITLTDILLFGKAGSTDVDNAKFAIYRRNILRWGGIAGYVDMIVSGVPPLILPDAIAGGLQYVKAFGGTEQRNLPLGYRQLEYIESTGTQAINTGINYDGNDFVVKWKAVDNSASNSTLFATKASSPFGGGFYGTNSSRKYYVGTQPAGGMTINYSSNDGLVHTWEATVSGQNATLKKDGTQVGTDTFTGTIDTTRSIYLFCGGWASSSDPTLGQFASWRLYSWQLWKSGVLAGNFIPAKRNSDNVIGMYDTVSGSFFTNVGTGTFAAGGEAVPTPDAPMDIVSNNGVLKARHASGLPLGYTLLDYIESSGTQYIDTGIIANNSTGFYVDAQKLNTDPDAIVIGSRESNSNTRCWVDIDHSNNGVLVFGWGDSKRSPNIIGTNRFQAFLNFMNSRNGIVDGQECPDFATLLQSSLPTQTRNLYLFRANYSGGDFPFVGKVYSVKISQNDTFARNFIPAKRNSDNVIGMYDTVSGQFFTNAGTGDFVAGNTVSDPVEIYADGVVETINIHGKNLFNKDATPYLSGQFINDTTTVGGNIITTTNGNYNVYRIPVSPSTTYTFGVIKAANPCWAVLDENGLVLQVGQHGAATVNSITVTTDATAKYLCLSVAVQGGYKCDDILQLEKGSTATTYEPYYDGGTATAEMLLSLGDYTDEQEIISGAVTRKLGVKVLDGTENWISGGGGTGVWANFQSITGVAFATTNAFCSHSVYGGANINIVNMNQNEFCLYDNGNVSFKNTYSTSTDDWKSFLADQYAAGTPVIIVYPLATETTDTVTGQPMNTTAGDNILEITQASLEDLEVEVKYQKVV